MDNLHQNFYTTYPDESVLLLDEALIGQENGIRREVSQWFKAP